MSSHRHLRRILLGTTGIAAALGLPGTGFAQNSDTLETVIVTAEKTATDLQKTSVSITAITPDTNGDAGNTRLNQMIAFVPAIQAQQGAGTQPAYYVRGIGTTQGVSSTLEMLDGLDTNALDAENFASADAARIEVLRGPQGVLYGRGAFGGLINIITNDPSNKYEAKIFVEGGSYNLIDSNATINIPLSDDMALRLVTVEKQMTGFMHPDGRAGQDFESMRGKLQFKPDDDFKIILKGDFLTSVSTGASDSLPQRVKFANFSSPAFGGFNPCGGNPVANPYDPWHSPPKYYGAYSCTVPAQLPVNPAPVTGVCQIVSRQDAVNANIGTEVDYDLGWSQFTFQGNIANSRAPLGIYADNPYLGTIPPNVLYSNIFNQVFDARLASPESQSFKWVAGIYYETDETDSNNHSRSQVSAATPLGTNTFVRQVAGDDAAYGQVTVPVLDRFRIIGGIRYSEDSLSNDQRLVNVLNGHLTATPADGNFPTHKITYKGGFEVDLDQDSMLYGDIANGFRPTVPATNAVCQGNTSKHAYAPGDGSGVVLPYSTSGGCATTAPAAATAVGGTAGETVSAVSLNLSVPPDSMTAYEMGLKNRFLDNKLQLNIDAYYYKFDSLFLSALGVNSQNKQAALYNSITGTKAWGGEIEGALLVTSNDRINFGLSYEPTEEGNNPYEFPQCYNYGVASHPAILDAGGATGAQSANFAACSAKNLAANPATVNWVRYHPAVSPNAPLASAPLWNGNVGYSHIFDLSSGASVTANATVHFQSGMQTAISYFYDGFNPSYHTTDMSLTYDTADGKWSLSAWVKNLENHAVELGAQSTGTGTDYVYPTWGQPRMWGINLRAKF